MSGTLTQMINDYYIDTNKNNNSYSGNFNYNKSNINYNNQINYKRNDNNYKRYNSPKRKINKNEDKSFLTPTRSRYFSEKTEKILNDIDEINNSLKDKIQVNMIYYNIPNQFKSNKIEEEKNYNNNNIKFRKIPNYYNPNLEFPPEENVKHYSYSLEKNYVIDQPNYNNNPYYNLKQGNNCPNNNNYYRELNYQINRNNPNESYLRSNDNEFINYMNIMVGLKNRKLNQWRREFKEDNFKY
jgi:hypothetical protein